LEIWQVKSGTIFDNILITDSVAEAERDRAEALTRKTAEQACEEAARKKEADAAAADKSDADKSDAETDDKEDL